MVVLKFKHFNSLPINITLKVKYTYLGKISLMLTLKALKFILLINGGIRFIEKEYTIEDDTDIREIIKLRLNKEGYKGYGS